MGIERISSGVQAGNCIGCVAILGAQRLSWSAYNEVGFPEVASTSKAGIIWSTPRKFRPIVQISLSLWEPLSTVGVVWIRYVSDQLPRLYIDKVICRCTIHLGGRFAHFGWGEGHVFACLAILYGAQFYYAQARDLYTYPVYLLTCRYRDLSGRMQHCATRTHISHQADPLHCRFHKFDPSPLDTLLQARLLHASQTRHAAPSWPIAWSRLPGPEYPTWARPTVSDGPAARYSSIAQHGIVAYRWSPW